MPWDPPRDRESYSVMSYGKTESIEFARRFSVMFRERYGSDPEWDAKHRRAAVRLVRIQGAGADGTREALRRAGIMFKRSRTEGWLRNSDIFTLVRFWDRFSRVPKVAYGSIEAQSSQGDEAVVSDLIASGDDE